MPASLIAFAGGSLPGRSDGDRACAHALRQSAWAALALAVFAAQPSRAAAPRTPPPNELVLVVGIDDLRQVNQQAFGTVRAQYACSFHGVRPFAQAGLAHAGSFYGGGGLLYDVRLTRRSWLTVASGPGWYRHRGNDPDLGYALEFASWVELSTTVMRQRVGITFGHLSNAHLGSRNPGTETLGLTWHLPVRTRARP